MTVFPTCSLPAPSTSRSSHCRQGTPCGAAFIPPRVPPEGLPWPSKACMKDAKLHLIRQKTLVDFMSCFVLFYFFNWLVWGLPTPWFPLCKMWIMMVSGPQCHGLCAPQRSRADSASCRACGPWAPGGVRETFTLKLSSQFPRCVSWSFCTEIQLLCELFKTPLSIWEAAAAT